MIGIRITPWAGAAAVAGLVLANSAAMAQTPMPPSPGSVARPVPGPPQVGREAEAPPPVPSAEPLAETPPDRSPSPSSAVGRSGSPSRRSGGVPSVVGPSSGSRLDPERPGRHRRGIAGPGGRQPRRIRRSAPDAFDDNGGNPGRRSSGNDDQATRPVSRHTPPTPSDRAARSLPPTAPPTREAGAESLERAISTTRNTKPMTATRPAVANASTAIPCIAPALALSRITRD